MDEDFAREERLKLEQDRRLYPLGRVLRETFDANNHDTLGSDVAGLMINLSQVPFERDTAAQPKRSSSASPQGLVARLKARWRRR